MVCIDSMQAQQNLSDGNAKREEIQRYFGYETLLYRYLSIPYDTTMNANERGDFATVGFLYLLLLPLLFLVRYRKKLWVTITIPLLLLFIFIISTSNGFIYNYDKNQMMINKEGTLQYQSDLSKDGPGTVILKGVYNVNNQLYKPFKSIGNAISGENDYVTYPIVLAIFFSFCALLYYNFRKTKRKLVLALAAIYFIFTFLWYLLSGGIVWYGFLSFFLGLICMILLLPKMDNTFNRTVNYSTYSLIGLWIFIGVIARISNINPSLPASVQGKNMVNPIFLQLLVGQKTEQQVIDRVYNNLSGVIKKINRDEKALVYRVGTSFTYFINDNHQRVFMDNQLSFFRALEKKYPDKIERAKALKASNFKYLIIDLNTPTLDNTPEQSLVNKYNGLLEFVYKNPKTNLLATNRQVYALNAEGGASDKLSYNVFGKVKVNGTYAVYEIL